MERRLAAILAADVVGYSRLMGSDEAGTLSRLKSIRHDRIDPVIAGHHGRIVKLMGDGALVEFASVVDAVACAAHIQATLAEHNAALDDDQRIQFRIGVNLGDVIVDDNDIFGDGVNIACRLQPLADPGGVTVSQTVRDHVGAKLPLQFDDLGEQVLKNISLPVRVFSVRHADSRADRHPGSRLSKPSIAVLPFANMSGDPEQDYFGDGIAEDIITDLSRISGLFVLARNTTFAHKGRSVDVQEMSRRLGVRFVLEGSVRRAGNRVRITAQLIEGSSGGHLWADRFDRELTEIFAVQDEITQRIVEALRVKLLPDEQTAIASPPTENVEAYEYFLRGRQLQSMYMRSSLERARRLFAIAVQVDPKFARAHAGIAVCKGSLAWEFGAPIAYDEVFAASARALELDPFLAEPYAARGLALAAIGRLDEAQSALRHAMRIDPNLWEAQFFFARACVMAGQLDEAVEGWRRAADLRAEDFASLMMAGMVLRRQGRMEASAAAYRLSLERAQRVMGRQPDNATAAFNAALSCAALGQAADARLWAARAQALEPDDMMTLYNVACTHSLLGDVNEAIDILQRVMPLANADRRMWMAHDGDLDALRGHPRFEALFAGPDG